MTPSEQLWQANWIYSEGDNQSSLFDVLDEWTQCSGGECEDKEEGDGSLPTFEGQWIYGNDEASCSMDNSNSDGFFQSTLGHEGKDDSSKDDNQIDTTTSLMEERVRHQGLAVKDGKGWVGENKLIGMFQTLLTNQMVNSETIVSSPVVESPKTVAKFYETNIEAEEPLGKPVDKPVVTETLLENETRHNKEATNAPPILDTERESSDKYMYRRDDDDCLKLEPISLDSIPRPIYFRPSSPDIRKRSRIYPEKQLCGLVALLDPPKVKCSF